MVDKNEPDKPPAGKAPSPIVLAAGEAIDAHISRLKAELSALQCTLRSMPILLVEWGEQRGRERLAEQIKKGHPN